MEENHLKKIYRESLALLTDFYQMTMSYGYWKAGLDKREAVFHLFFRTLPFDGGYAVAAGLEAVVEFLESFRFKESDIAYLATLKAPDGKLLFEESFFDYLLSMNFTCDVDAVKEGTVVFPYEPLIRVKGPLVQCQLLESPLLNLFNFPSLIATKASRVCMAAKGDPVLEFGLRRAQGIDGALTASRAAYIGGCESTSNILAGKLFGIPVKGTHSHSWVMVFDDELESFMAFARHLPSSCIFLVDTYNTIQGVEKAIEAGKNLRQHGHEMVGIRLDSGDLAELSIQAREMLDKNGFQKTIIVASNELNETIISELKKQGAKIDAWGVGTNLVTGKDQPALDGVYKLSAIQGQDGEWKYKLKLSEQMRKVSNPGILQVRRFRERGVNIADAIFDVHSNMDKNTQIIDPFDATKESHIDKGTEFEDLLVPIFREGKKVYELPSPESIRKRTQEELALFPTGVKRFLNPHQYIVGMERSLYDLKIKLVKNIRSQNAHDFIIPEKGNKMRGLIVVDVQVDFLPGGALAVPEGDKVIPIINELLKLPFDTIAATKDWHPKDHCSFGRTGDRIMVGGIEQILWPEHCVQGSKGAEFSDKLDVSRIEHVVHKGADQNVDSYSTFFNNKHLHDTGLDAFLKKKGVDEIYIAGLATDYCVRNSVLDALKLGYRVFVVREGCRAVNLEAGDEERALVEMEESGAKIVSLNEVKRRVCKQ